MCKGKENKGRKWLGKNNKGRKKMKTILFLS